ncbi:MAG: Mov34/MPN/PAD-1 family protein [Candidatus Lutacidiplasmatales archaeon]
MTIPTDLFERMCQHARETYPDECCGVLIGATSEQSLGPDREILALERTRNEFDGERRRRFLIPPEELRILERRLEGSGRQVVGFYHSHPDHPARPSQFDQDHAWPWYSYVVLAITAQEVPGAGAFELDPDRSVFRELRLSVTPKPVPASAVVGG